jgi:hypothetical protein
MKMKLLTSCACAALITSGCTSHLVFMEESHMGLKVRVGGSAPSPYEIGLGYRRGMVAAVPKQKAGKNDEKAGKESRTDSSSDNASKSIDVETETIELIYDPKELMSMYTEFCANVGFDNPIEFHHLIVTGDAAIWLLADGESGLRQAMGDVAACFKAQASSE